MAYETLEILPLTMRIGAEIGGVDLSRPTNRQLEEIAQAIADYQVIFFRDQHLDHDSHKAFGRAFGYYDGFVFEVRSAALDAERPVSAGGRYDGLMTRLGGKARTGAVGCMVRPWRAWSEGER